MKIYRIAQNEDEIILPVGTKLYHGTSEEFDQNEIRTGGYDNVFWTCDDPMIAKTYIPVAGGISSTSTRAIASPSTDPNITKIQKAIGIDYDQSTFEIKGPQVISYRPADIFNSNEFRKGQCIIDQEAQANYVNQKIPEILGYQPENARFDGGWTTWRFRWDLDRLMGAEERVEGRLFTVTLDRDFRIWDKTDGGRLEGDLMDVDYHKIGLFRSIEGKGYDGIKINDYCQSHDMGNVGHHAIGIFGGSLKDITIESSPAYHEDLESYFRGRCEVSH